MKIFGFEFAPLFIPFKRRLQTAAVFQWTASFLFLGFSCLGLFIYLFFTQFFYIPLAYLAWLMYDFKKAEEGGRRWECQMNNPVWKYFRDYFPIKLIKTADLDPTKNYIAGYHPHGIMSAGGFCNFATNATGFEKIFPKMRSYLCILTGQFWFPIFREYLMTSACCAVSKRSLCWILQKEKKGNFLVIVLGGATEALEANPGKFILNLKKRKGFVKLALQNGAHLVPVYSFGENDIFLQMQSEKRQWMKSLQVKLTNIVGFSPPVFHGRGIFNYTFGIVPFRKPINTIVGKPIELPQIENPTQEEIDEYHQKYLTGLQDLFEEYKGQYGIDEMQHLEIH